MGDVEVQAPSRGLIFGRYPKSTAFIIGQEFSERATYYGLRAILVIYFTSYFDYNDDKATVFYHAFVMCSYASAIFGGMLADSGWGKFKTIFLLSLVYCAGSTILAVTSINDITGSPPNPWGAFLGLGLIAVGTGGIKPCVSAFGGDQFAPEQQQYLQSFFAAFYFSINAGSLLSTVTTPKLRADVQCFGDDECYPLAFGVPAILMALATIVFVSGRKHYIHKMPERNVILDFARVMWIGIKDKVGFWLSRPGSVKHDHWLDPALKRYDEPFVRDIRAVLAVFVLFLPTPLFWTLFDQQGSRWTLQAQQMETFEMGALGRFRPDMMQAINALLVLMLIPLFENLVYPAIAAMRIRFTPLRRMSAGMLLCGLAFLVSALVQIKIDRSHDSLAPSGHEFQLRALNACDNSSLLESSLMSASLLADTASSYQAFPFQSGVEYDLMAVIGGVAAATRFLPAAGERYSVVLACSDDVTAFVTRDPLRTSEDDSDASSVRIRFINTYAQTGLHVDMPEIDDVDVAPLAASDYESGVFDSGKLRFGLFQTAVDNSNTTGRKDTLQAEFRDGGDYTIVYAHEASAAATSRLVVDAAPNSVSIAWQVPQYVVMSCGEILFSITGLELAFAEAPATMKAVVQAGWLLTTTVGSLIVIIVAETSMFKEQSDEFFFYSAAMLGVTIIFGVIAMRYNYRSRQYTTMELGELDTDSTDTAPLIDKSKTPTRSRADSSDSAASTSFA